MEPHKGGFIQVSSYLVSIKLGCKGLPQTRTLSYFPHRQWRRKKSFI